MKVVGFGQYWRPLISVLCLSIVSSFSFVITANAASPHPACVAGGLIENAVVDCAGIEIGLDCPDDNESQPAVLTLKNATVKNLVLSASGGADGIHCSEGDCVLENVVWKDICEDAATLEHEGKSLTIIGGAAYNYATGPGGKPDKVFQHNSKDSTIHVTGGFELHGVHGKLWRSCGNCTKNGGPRHLILDDVVVDAEIYAISGLNRNYGDTVKISNLKVKNYREGLPIICEEYKGIVKHSDDESAAYGETWNSKNCQVDKSDIISF